MARRTGQRQLNAQLDLDDYERLQAFCEENGMTMVSFVAGVARRVTPGTKPSGWLGEAVREGQRIRAERARRARQKE